MQSIEQEIVDHARAWVGTPYRDKQRARGLGADCVGLIIGVGLETGLLPWDESVWSEFAGYSRTPNPRKMGRAIEHFLRPIMVPPLEAPRDGSIAWMGWRAELPMHLGIVATLGGRRTLIHAYQNVGRVVEHGFSAEWPGRVMSWWRYPGAPEE